VTAARRLHVVGSVTDLRGRIALALSVLQQRRFCPTCRPSVTDAIGALKGKTIDQIREGRV
jgi:hypothetical protein